MRHLLRSLRSGAEDTLTCEECRARLPSLLAEQDEGAGTGEAVAWAEVQTHLDQCPACSELYEELVALGDLEPDLPPQGAPDLSFLPREPALIFELGALREAVIRFGRGLADSLRAPGPAPAFAGLRDAGGEVTERLGPEQTGQSFSAAVTVRTSPDDPRRCTLLVVVTPAGRAWPDLDGTVVTLRRGATILGAEETDPHGEVSFADIAVEDLARLSLVIDAARPEA